MKTKKSHLFRLIDKACKEYNFIEDGDKIVVGASGGKDSSALIEYLAERKRQNREKFDFVAFHVATDIAPEMSSDLKKRFDEWNVRLVERKISVLERIAEGKKMNCWWCSTQRRSEMAKFALENGFNKIALGHHLDDILETVLMNILQKTELSTMPPKIKYDNYPITVIRPLCLAPETQIIAHCTERGFITSTCTCNYQNNSTRKSARKKIALLTDGDEKVKMKIYRSLQNINKKYLP